MILRSVFHAVTRGWLTLLLLLFVGLPGVPTTAFAADQQEMVGHWSCVHARWGSCAPDGRGRGAEDFWTYPIHPKKRSVTCAVVKNDRTGVVRDSCTGIHFVSGFWRPDGFESTLICPTGFVPSVSGGGQCVEVKGQNCPVTAGGLVDVATGRATGIVADWRSDGPTPLELTRSYTSQDTGLATPSRSRLGNAWRTNFDAAAVWSGQLSSTSLVHIVLPDSLEYSFSRKNGVWSPVWPRLARSSIIWDQPRTGLDLSLTVSAGAVTLRVPDGRRYVFNDKGQLARIEFPDGHMQTLTYRDGLNTLVSDSMGRWLEFTYGGAGQPATLLSSVRTSDGKVLLYGYEDRIFAGDPQYRAKSSSTDQWALASVTYPNETPEAAGNPKAVYEYLPSSVRPFLLTGATDQDGVETATWTYDSKGRATSNVGIGGANRWSFVYDDVAGTVAVTYPEGLVTVYSQARGLAGTPQRFQAHAGKSNTTAQTPSGQESRGECFLGLFCLDKAPPPVCAGPSEDHALEECRKAADGNDDDWRAFCKSSKWFVRFDVRRPARCLEESYKPPVSKKNWCYNEFGE